MLSFSVGYQAVEQVVDRLHAEGVAVEKSGHIVRESAHVLRPSVIFKSHIVRATGGE